MVICYIIGCKSRTETKSQDITFHTFPKDSAIRQLWIRATGRPNWQLTKYTRICSRHFEQSCFRKTALNITYLKPFSIPTLHIVEQVPMEILSTSIELPVDIPSTSHHIPMQIDSIPTQCQVEVINRVHCSLNIRSSGKYLKSTLALGKEPKNDKEYFILHFSSVNKNGTKYKLKSIKQVFVKCLNEGKATIRFAEPPHDLCIKSEVIQLKSFMRLLKSCVTGDTKDLKLSNLSTIGVTAKDIVPTKLTIHDRSEFPARGLPRTLECLYIVGLKLCNFRRDILLLNNLAILDLSNNEIEKIPAEFGRLPNISELYLANNSLGIKEIVDWKWLFGPQITKKLKLLDLSGNKIKELPKSIWKLQNLITLKIDNNNLKRLPASLGRINTLRYLTVSQNNLQSLPCGLMQCRLDYIDLSTNMFISGNSSLKAVNYSHWDFYINSLVHIAAKVILNNKFFYAPNLIPWTLVEFLDNANMCVCGKPVLNDSYFVIKEFELKDLYRVVVFNNSHSCAVGFECYFCSPKCFVK